MQELTPNLDQYVDAIRNSNLTIYSPITIGDPVLWIPSPELEKILDNGLRGISLAGSPIKTRSKVAKQHVCRVLGYPIPSTFKKTEPRFPGQFFDTYVQKSNNLQVWNQGLSPTRRYVLIRVSANDVITRVKVVTGASLALLDTTGTLTQKYQARCIPTNQPTELVVSGDTALLQPLTGVSLNTLATPIDEPALGQILPIAEVFNRLSNLIGVQFKDSGYDQERNRGAGLHQLVCEALGYSHYQDGGQFPDVRHQLLEVKLQTAPTIDLGLVLPSSTEALDVPMIQGQQIRHCDVRYAVFYGN